MFLNNFWSLEKINRTDKSIVLFNKEKNRKHKKLNQGWKINKTIDTGEN